MLHNLIYKLYSFTLNNDANNKNFLRVVFNSFHSIHYYCYYYYYHLLFQSNSYLISATSRLCLNMYMLFCQECNTQLDS